MIARLLNMKLFKFLVGGAITVSVEYVIFIVLYVLLDWNLLLANTLSFICGLGVSFLFNRSWAFSETEYRHRGHHQAIMYAILAATNLLLNNLIVASLEKVAVDPRIGKFVAIILVAAWNFVIYHKVIFAKPSNR